MELKEILNLDTKELYFYFLKFVDDDKDAKKIYPKIRWGFNLEFDIYDFLYNYLTEKPKRNIVIINNQIFERSDFFSEIEEREKKMREIIFKNLENVSVVVGR